MFGLLVFLQVLIAFLLIVVVLLQSGKGGGLAGAFGGGGGNQTVFGGRGAVDFLGKATWILGAVFMLNSLFLAMAAGNRSGGGGLIEKSVVPATAPVTPGTLPGGGIPGDETGLGEPLAPGTQSPVTPQAPPVPAGTPGSGTGDTPATDPPASGETPPPSPGGGGN